MRALPAFGSVLVACLLSANAISGQTVSRVTQAVDTAQMHVLPSHRPRWASDANISDVVPAASMMDSMTIILSRSQDRETAFEKLLAGQQNPASPDYHHWLTPTEVGERFGVSQQDTDAVAGWLHSQGLQVNWVSPSRLFLNFSGNAANVGRAFRTELHYYNVNGERVISVSSDPMIPAALERVIKAVRGLSTSGERPGRLSGGAVASPRTTFPDGAHYLSPADFNTIYDVPSTYTGTGITIGIVGASRTDFADFMYFRQLTGSTFPDPTEIIPTGFGGTDPGPAYTAPPSGASPGLQQEATLDVTRAGSGAPGANLLLVVSGTGIAAPAQYLVQTSPVPVQVMNLSFVECEANGGQSGVIFWDKLFQQAAAEGISVFVSSGDTGASGCDESFTTPPANPLPNSPNFICSSSYATCVGGTEFADTSNPFLYWSSTNNSQLGSALGYIPEGAWNEPLTSSSMPQTAASGGGVSQYIATPQWQVGTGVPSARSGRYTPDIAFSASAHNGYLYCFAAGGYTCVPGPGDLIGYISGTSAAAPSMAAVAALLDQELQLPQGNLNPELYHLAAIAPAVFHDVTVTSSAVASCDVNVPSMCNNSIPGSTGLTGGQAGYLVETGYDEATGLGSLDVGNFLNAFGTSPVIATFVASPVTVTGPGTVDLTVTLSGPAPSGNSGALISLSSSNTPVFPVTTPYLIPPGQTTGVLSFTVGAVTTATPVIVTATYNGSSEQASVTVEPPSAPSISFAIPNQTYGNPPFSIAATSASTGTFTYSVTSGPATISGSTVTLTGVGSVDIQAAQAAAPDYTSGVADATFTVAPATPTISFSVINQTYGVAPFTVSAVSNSPGAITYSVVSGPAAISGSTVTLIGVGTVVLQASQAALANYTSGVQTTTFTVAAQTPAIVFAVPNHTYGDAPFTVAATSNSSGAITYLVVTGPATISGSTVTVTGAGTVVLQANQVAAGNYAAGTMNATFAVAAAAPSITFAIPDHTYGSAPFLVSATSNSSGAITYSVVSGPVTISGSTLTLTGTGTAVVQANQAATVNFTAGAQTATFAVAIGSQTITFTAPGSPINYGVAPIPLFATASSGLAVNFSVLSGPGSVSGSILTIRGAGTIVIGADQSGSTNYSPASEVTHSIAVNKIAPAVGLTTSTNPILVQNALTLTATVGSAAGTPTGSVIFSDGVSTIGMANLNGGVAALTSSTLAVGSHSISAVYSGDGNFNSTSSPALTVTVEDFTLAVVGGGSSQTLQPGGTATYSLLISPSGGDTVPAAVTLSVSGLPTGFVATFTSASLPAGSTAANVTVMVQVPQTGALQRKDQPGKTLALVAFGVLLPFLGGIGRAAKRVRLAIVVLLLAGAGGVIALIGCGGTGTGGETSSPPQTYNFTVTATSGALSHSTTLTINVQ